ncbi:MAG: tail protein X [Eubacteriales bacterium]|jgi:phage tail protein X
MSTYTTIQGDTWDGIAYKLYGDEKHMKELIEANWPVVDTLVFSAGVELNVPDLPEESSSDLPIWRQTSEETETS